MNFSYLTLNDQIPLTAALVGEQRQLIEGIPAVAWLLPRLEEVHAAAAQLQAITEADQRIQDYTLELMRCDEVHDRAVRCLFHGLSVAADSLRLSEPSLEAAARELEQLRDRLLPDGLSLIIRAWSQEAGYAARVKQGLTASMEAQLERVQVGGLTALAMVRHWLAAGERLADLERRRAETEALKALPANASQVRWEWTKTVDLFLQVLEGSRAPAETVTALRAPFADAVARAQARALARAARAAKAADSPQAAPTEG